VAPLRLWIGDGGAVAAALAQPGLVPGDLGADLGRRGAAQHIAGVEQTSRRQDFNLDDRFIPLRMLPAASILLMLLCGLSAYKL